MSLFRFIENVSSALVEEVQARAGKELQVGLWQDAAAKNDAPPRIVFVPGPDTFAAAVQSLESARAGGRSIATRAAALQLRIWGCALNDLSEDQGTEWLVHRAVAALRAQAHGSMVFATGQWAQPAKVQRGRLYVLDTAIHIPVLEEATVFHKPNALRIVAQLGETPIDEITENTPDAAPP